MLPRAITGAKVRKVIAVLVLFVLQFYSPTFQYCLDVGIYEFNMGATGKKVKGRYSFIYVYEDGEWKINHHHSSIMPEGIVTAQPVTKDEIRTLFTKWNNALASKDPKKVAECYAKNSVLLPTVSDVPRTDFPGLVDYFTNFLKLEPQGKIESGDIIIGTNWAQDAGIYEFTMGATGAKVKGRYTYVYVSLLFLCDLIQCIVY